MINLDGLLQLVKTLADKVENDSLEPNEARVQFLKALEACDEHCLSVIATRLRILQREREAASK